MRHSGTCSTRRATVPTEQTADKLTKTKILTHWELIFMFDASIGMEMSVVFASLTARGHFSTFFRGPLKLCSECIRLADSGQSIPRKSPCDEILFGIRMWLMANEVHEMRNRRPFTCPAATSRRKSCSGLLLLCVADCSLIRCADAPNFTFFRSQNC